MFLKNHTVRNDFFTANVGDTVSVVRTHNHRNNGEHIFIGEIAASYDGVLDNEVYRETLGKFIIKKISRERVVGFNDDGTPRAVYGTLHLKRA